MRNPEIGASTYYHVFNRGVDKRNLFLNREDYFRFYQSMYLFNDKHYAFSTGDKQTKDERLSSWEIYEHEREPVVEIAAFELSPNHFHLLLRQLSEGGISEFLHDLAGGYAKYFNLKYDRQGRLYESPFKAVPVDFDEHLYHLPRYIHLNGLDREFPDWREGRIDDWERALAFLDGQEWSSHHVYMGRDQLLPVVDATLAKLNFSTKDQYVNYLKDWAGRRAMPEALSLTLSDSETQ